ncbi:MAG: hypothetical protein KatS3mg087_1311 [Patescibacteria group bacterium]|nr:MAG: hypothetical protein KatS3mg087_1311 [Patescibacteria group bacterium]
MAVRYHIPVAITGHPNSFYNAPDKGIPRYRNFGSNVPFFEWKTIQDTLKTDILTANGDMLYRDGSGNVARLPAGNPNWVLTGNSTTGIPEWNKISVPLSNDLLTAQGDLLYRDTLSVGRLPIGTANQVLSSNGSLPGWNALATLLANAILTANGDLLYRDGSGNVTRLSIGSNGQVLKVSSGLPSWQNESSTTVHFERIANYNNTTTNVSVVTLSWAYQGTTTPIMIFGTLRPANTSSTYNLRYRINGITTNYAYNVQGFYCNGNGTRGSCNDSYCYMNPSGWGLVASTYVSFILFLGGVGLSAAGMAQWWEDNSNPVTTRFFGAWKNANSISPTSFEFSTGSTFNTIGMAAFAIRTN